MLQMLYTSPYCQIKRPLQPTITSFFFLAWHQVVQVVQDLKVAWGEYGHMTADLVLGTELEEATMVQH